MTPQLLVAAAAILAVLVLGPRPGHVPWPEGDPLDPGGDRFVADDGSPGPYHDRGAAARAALASLALRAAGALSVDVVALAGAVAWVWIVLVVLPGFRYGWWAALAAASLDLMGAGR